MARRSGVCSRRMRSRAAAPIASRSESRTSRRNRSICSGPDATSTSRPMEKMLSRPCHQSLMTGAPHAPASNSRTLGE